MQPEKFNGEVLLNNHYLEHFEVCASYNQGNKKKSTIFYGRPN